MGDDDGGGGVDGGLVGAGGGADPGECEGGWWREEKLSFPNSSLIF